MDSPPAPRNRVFPAVAALALVVFVIWLGAGLWDRERVLGFHDVPVMGLPNFQFLGEAFRQGFLPDIHLRRGAGTPFLADPQTCAWYPVSWLAALFPPEDAFRLFQFLHLVWLGLGWFFLAIRLGAGPLGSLFIGVTALTTQPVLHCLEWVPITAGNAWVPWIFLLARTGRPRVWAGAQALAVLSGHAYLWIMMPVVSLASLCLAPPGLWRRFLLCLLLVPLLAAPVWMGYLGLSSEVQSHGSEGIDAEMITWFEPGHYAGFLMPRAMRDFIFTHPDGRQTWHVQAGQFGWSRYCYLGLLPVLLLPVGILMARGPHLHAVLTLLLGGVCLGTLAPLLLGGFSRIFIHVHHPATFVQLITMGICLALPLAWRGLVESSPGSGGLPESRGLPGWQRFYVLMVIGTLILAIVHEGLSQRALAGETSPLWNFSLAVNWQAYPLAVLIAGVLAVICSGFAGARPALKTGLGICLIVLQLYDLAEFNFPRLPFASRPTEPLAFFLPERVRSDGRIWFTREILSRALGSVVFKDKPVSPEFRAYWIARSDLPNIASARGFFQLNDYNPPFAHLELKNLLERLEGENRLEELDRLLALVGVEFIVAEEGRAVLAAAAANGWTLEATRPLPGNRESLQVWRRPGPAGPRVIDRPALERFDRGEPLGASLVASFAQVRWGPNSCRIEIGDGAASGASGGGPVLFVPLTPFKGWRASVDGKAATTLPRQGFGLAVPLPPGARVVELHYRQPLLFESLVMLGLGLAGLGFAMPSAPSCRPRRAPSTTS